jgi:hypothetical protein
MIDENGNYVQDERTNSQNVNKGKPIYYKNALHYIVHEFDDNVIISSNEDLSKAYLVKKSLLSIKPKK